MAPLILSLTLLSIAALCNADSKSCPGGRQHGDQFEVGRYWYECKDGQTVPMGCLSESGSRIRVQDTFDTQDARMQCVLDGDGYLAILYKSCMADGREHMLGDQWDDGQVWYICKKENAAVRSSPIGCITDGQQIPFDEKVAKADQVYQCKQAGPQRKAEMVIAGCAKNGNKYAIGETYEGGKFWYTCTDSGSKIVGCMHNGQRLKDGDTYHDSDVLYSCKVDGDRTSGVPYGCITYEDGVESEKKFDCFWTEGNAPYQYEMTCKHDRDRNTAVKVKTRCSYKGPEGVFRVEPGCYTHANDLAVGCIKSGSDLETRTFPGDTVDSSYGLRAC